MTPVVAVYAGTFDPITRGHEELVRRAASLFHEVVLAVADSRGKSPLFEPAEREAIAREALAIYPNVRVVRFSGLLVNLLRAQGARVVVRGLRGVTDFDYEFQLAGMNSRLMPEIETVFMTPTDEYRHVSATLVREIATLGGDVAQFDSPVVFRHLQDKIAERARQA